MTEPTPQSTACLPHGLLMSGVGGVAAGGVAWLLTTVSPALTTSYSRLDQLAALGLGGVVGAAVLGLRALRQRERLLPAALAGALLGGVGALSGASLLAFMHAPASPRSFLGQRMVAWMLTSAGASALLIAWRYRRRVGRAFEGPAIAAAGGLIAGAIFTLPGDTEVWQALAFLWTGATIGIAVCGPELWHARAIVELLPARDARPGLLSIREWPLHDGSLVDLGEAQLACHRGRVALYPPAGGIVAVGRTVRQPTFVATSGLIAVGRTRYRLRLREAP